MKKKHEQWLEHYRLLALNGDPEAQIALAWEYESGAIVEKNVAISEELFKQAEIKEPLIARFNLAKARLMRGELPSKELEHDGAAGFGPAYYLIATYYYKKNDLPLAIKYYILASDNGHIVSEYLVWRLAPKRFTLFMKKIPRMLQILKIYFSMRLENINDPRILI